MKGTSRIQYDVIVIGGGPAGLMACIAASEHHVHCALVEKGDKLGRKLGISGGGRCNVTNAKPLPELMQNIPGNSRFLYSALTRFSNADIRLFFEQLGIQLKEEDRGRVFPVSDKASTVVNALVREVVARGVEIWEEQPVERLVTEPIPIQDNATSASRSSAGQPSHRVTGVLLRSGQVLYADAVVIATGGCSVPQTGSTGDAYPWAKAVGHTVVTPYPTEVPLTSPEPFITSRQLQGLSLRSVDITIRNSKGKALTTENGDMIFTHFGLSGPAALRCSHYVSTAKNKNPSEALRAEIDCIPTLSRDELFAAFKKAKQEEPKKHVENVLTRWLPERLAAVALDQAHTAGTTQMGHLKNQSMLDLSDTLKAFSLIISGTLPLAKATVTGGGVSVKEVAPQTMASKLCEGLYFAGEVLDVHAHTGGYNITVAFSTGHLAGNSAAEFAKNRIHPVGNASP